MNNAAYNILVLADSTLPIPPTGYGGVERIISYLIDELARRGHQITLMAHPASCSPGRLIPFSESRDKNKLLRGLAKWRFHRLLRREIPRHDLVHSVIRLDYLLPALQAPIPKVLNFQNPIAQKQVSYIERWGKGKIALTACGEAMIAPFRDSHHWQAVHNCVDVHRYSFEPTPQTPHYLAFLGRITPYKGLVDAIHISRLTGIPLRIGGNIGSMPEDQRYFFESVQPHIDGSQIQYLGELDDPAKMKLLGGALAFLNPILWDEPFGIVNVESLACGTPVLTYPRGEPPLLIKNGVTGFVCRDREEMANRIAELGNLSRAACRADAQERFSVAGMVDKMEAIYRRLLTEN